MNNKKTISAIRDFIVTAEKSIKNANKLLNDLLKENEIDLNSEIELNASWLNNYNSWDSKIIEWVFTWTEMMWSDWNNYPVPANYSSKSKLVQWDKLKVTIDPSGRMMYKQIAPIERENITWLLSKDKDKYQVVCGSKTFDVLTAAVTHFKWDIWDSVTVIVPAWKDATFAAIDNIIPKS